MVGHRGTVAVVGLGLIGGSMAKALHAYTAHKVVGFDHSPLVLQAALRDNAIEEIVTDDFSAADCILIALYPGDTLDFIRRHRATFSAGAVVIDLCGVKRVICSEAATLLAGSGAFFLGGHPMAGRESSGYPSADAGLFAGASMILTPLPDTPPGLVAKAGALFRSLGFGHIEVTTPERHDEMIAYTSQLAHVVSSAYVCLPAAEDYRGFSAGSFRDLTRVAKLNEEMWSELFLCNGDYLSGQIDALIQHLARLRDCIGEQDRDSLCALLRRGRKRKERLE